MKESIIGKITIHKIVGVDPIGLILGPVLAHQDVPACVDNNGDVMLYNTPEQACYGRGDGHVRSTIDSEGDVIAATGCVAAKMVLDSIYETHYLSEKDIPLSMGG
jgi:hypothetical protein